jgi:hypothetical protein
MNSCGLQCTDKRVFETFLLCYPWAAGSAMYLFIIAIVILFVGTLFTGMCTLLSLLLTLSPRLNTAFIRTKKQHGMSLACALLSYM